MDFQFKDLVDVKLMQRLTDTLYSAFGIPSAIITSDGEVLTGSGWQKICTDFHRKNPDTEKDCIESDTCLAKMIDEGKKYCIYKCPRGLIDSCSPIELEGKHVGNVFTGQFFVDPPTVETESFFRMQAKTYGFDEDDYLEAFRSIPIFSREKHTLMLDVLVNLASMLSEIGLARKREIEKTNQVQISEERFRNIAESMSDWIWEVDDKGIYTFVSLNIESTLGYKSNEIIGKTPFDFMDPKEAERVSLLFKRIAAQKAPINDLENWNMTKNGRSICLLTNGIPLLDEQGKLIGYRGVDKNITELKRLQSLELRARRLETAGTIAGQVAHDFNNLLAPMMAYPELIREELPPKHPALAYLNDIENSAKKIADINQQLLTLCRRGHYNQKPLDLNKIIPQAIKEIMSLSENITWVTDLDPALMNILGGESQIHRVITNLLRNAIDAIQNVGQIHIKTENYYADDKSGVYCNIPKGEYVRLTISDTGCGISDDIIQKIIDPFFTTKTSNRNRGSGLGLSVVDAVVKDHNGYLDLETRPGKGTSFYINFPATRLLPTDDFSDNICGGHEKVLVVDDDETQRTVSTNLLRRLGYIVTAIESGEKAVEFLKNNPQDILILDMIMPPGIDGTETYQRILQFNPNQKAIIISGFSESARVFEAQRLGAGAFVKKPITRQVIAAAIRAELNRPANVSV